MSSKRARNMRLLQADRRDSCNDLVGRQNTNRPHVSVERRHDIRTLINFLSN